MNRLSDRLHTACRLFAVYAAVCSSGIVAAEEPKRAPDHVVVDGVKIPFDKTVEVVGPCLLPDFWELRFSYAHASLLGLRIEGRANQEDIAFHLLAQTEEDVEKLRSLTKGAYYKVRGQIVGAGTWGPNPICNFKVEHIEAVPAAPLRPADFINRVASFEGIATAKGAAQGDEEESLRFVGSVASVTRFAILAQVDDEESLRLAGLPAWPENIEGKRVLVRGSVERGEQGLRLAMPTWKLIDLADLASQEVSLDGTLWSLNGHWWFSYRGEKLYLTGDAGPPLTFPSDEHGRTATVTGKLVRQLRPSLDQISLKEDRDLVQTYVVRGAQITFRDDSTNWNDRFRTVYKSRNKVSEGVPELLAEPYFRKNLIGNETDAMLYAGRNDEAIGTIVRDATPAARDVLARRMNDAQVDQTLRMLYAAILARVNDERGREFLQKLAESPGDVPKNEIYYCLGIFPFLGAEGGDEIATDCAWAEETLIAIISDPDSAEAAANFSSIPLVLATINSPATRKALLDHALRTSGDPPRFSGGPSTTSLLCHPSMNLSAEDLMRLEAATKHTGTRRIILQALLRLKHPAAAERFLKELDDGFAYMDFRDLSSPEVLAALKPQLPQLTGEAKSYAQMLLILGEKDPIPTLLALLNDAEFSDKNLVMFELARLADARAVEPVARILREAPRGYFANEQPVAATAGIKHALNAIANTGSREAVRELIELLDADLNRLGGYIDRAGLQRIVATHLIEITGESFGIDQAGWRAWEKAQPDEKFRPAKPAPNQDETSRTGPDNRIDLGR